MTMRRRFGAAHPVTLTALVVAGCAASQPQATTPDRQEIVVDEGTVVQVRRAGGTGVTVLPPLPAPIANTSRPFQDGFARAQTLLHAPGPNAPPEQGDEAAARAWLDAQFKPWLEQRLAAIVALVEAFAGMTLEGDFEAPHEHVVASALLGLVNGRTYDQLTAVPAPAHVRGDAALLRVYQAELHTTLAGGLLGAAIVAHRSCAAAAAQQRELSFGPWLDLCHAQLAARLQQQSQALALHEAVKAERAAERLAAEGPRPAGPEICWAPSALQTAAAHVPSARGPGAQRCALDAQPNDPLAAQALSPRDLRYGPRDPESGVRVSAALTDNPTMDARPLAWIATQSRLARCFAKHVPAAQAITVAVHAHLSVGAQGRTQSVTLTPEPSDASATPSAPFAQCLRSALQQTAFGCSTNRTATQARATFCLRRD
jgi:hypothetical protein